MYNVIAVLQNQLDYANLRLTEGKDETVKCLEKLSSHHKSTEYWEGLVQEYQEAISLLSNHERDQL